MDRIYFIYWRDLMKKRVFMLAITQDEIFRSENRSPFKHWTQKKRSFEISTARQRWGQSLERFRFFFEKIKWSGVIAASLTRYGNNKRRFNLVKHTISHSTCHMKSIHCCGPFSCRFNSHTIVFSQLCPIFLKIFIFWSDVKMKQERF